VANLFCGVLEGEGTDVCSPREVEGEVEVGCVEDEDMVT
jgi:hypothetical protein